MTENKPIKIEFAPGCFDSFEGTQEELNELVSHIQEMFANKTREEIEAESHELSDEDWDELDDAAKEQIARSIMDLEDDAETRKRKLQ